MLDEGMAASMAASLAMMKDPGGIVVGVDPIDGELLIDKTPKHLRFVGASGTGKTTSFFMPTLSRTWRGSAIIHDRKKELYLLLQGTRKWRHNLLFAPTERGSVRFNPFMEIATSDDQVTDAQNIAHLLPHGGKINVREPIWDQSSVALVSAMILYVLNFCPDRDKNFGGLIQLHEEREAGSAKMQIQQHPDPWIRNFIASAARKIYDNTNEKYVGSILATIDAYLEPFNNKRVAETLSESEFRVADLVCNDAPVALFLHLPPDHSERLAPVARILISQILNKMMSSLFMVDGRNKRHHLLFALDEYNRFGKINAIDGAFADMRGYGCRAMIGAQSDGVLTDIYGENALTLSQSRLIALRPDYVLEAERISKMLPKVRRVRESESDSYGGLGERSGVSTSRSQVEEPLLRPDEILSMSLDRVIIPGHAKPLDVRRPGWEHWLTLCDPKPLAMEPNPVVEMLPVRAEGRYIDMPPEAVPRNPWSGVQHPGKPPEPEKPPHQPPADVEPEQADPKQAEPPLAHGDLEGKPFDWKEERSTRTRGKRSRVYADALLIYPAPAGQEVEPPPQEQDATQEQEAAPIATVDDFDLV